MQLYDQHGHKIETPKKREPLQVHYDEATDQLAINGVLFAGVIFRKMAFPRGDRVYYFERKGDYIDIAEVGVLEDGERNLFVGPTEQALPQ